MDKENLPPTQANEKNRQATGNHAAIKDGEAGPSNHRPQAGSSSSGQQQAASCSSGQQQAAAFSTGQHQAAASSSGQQRPAAFSSNQRMPLSDRTNVMNANRRSNEIRPCERETSSIDLQCNETMDDSDTEMVDSANPYQAGRDRFDSEAVSFLRGPVHYALLPNPEIIDVDASAVDEVSQCTTYRKDIAETWFLSEEKHRIMVDYMIDVQPDINPSMRAILVDWLNEVSQEYRLLDQTLYLAVNYVDRFLTQVPVSRGKLQLVGVTCLWIASKYEEILPPTVDDFVYITDNTYSRVDVLGMEKTVLKTLHFNLTVVTPLDFHSRLLESVCADASVRYLARYLMELTLQEYGFVKYRPSHISVASIILSLHTTGMTSITASLLHYARCTVADIAPVVRDIHAAHQRSQLAHLQAVRDRYGHSNYMRIAHLEPVSSLPNEIVDALQESEGM